MTPDSLYNPFATPASGRDAIADAHAAIDQMERDARERRAANWHAPDERPEDEDWRITDEEE